MADDTFEPKLGKLRTTKSRRARRYLHQVLQAANLAGGLRGKAKSKFRGSRIGRGAGVGRVLAARDRYAAHRIRRVVIKTRIVKLAGQGIARAGRHLRYLQRDGVTREGESGTLYDKASDQVDGKAFLDRCDGDRHQFRIIVSAEDGEQYDELKGFTRRLMAQVESDLGTKLDWVAVDHFNTGHPHSHIVLRGKDDHGRDLVIARDYIAVGMRERAAEIVAFDLGPKSDREIERQLAHEVEQERFTSIDRKLLRDANPDGLVLGAARPADAVAHSLRVARLQKLKRLRLAEETRPGIWRLTSDLEPVLRRMGERGDIIKTLHRAMAVEGRTVGDYAIFVAQADTTLVGRVAAQGLSDEVKDRHYLIIDGTDGRCHYVDIGRPGAEGVPHDAIVEITAKPADARRVDVTVAEIAAAHDGRYSPDLHRTHDPQASAEFIAAHVRRLEALRQATGTVARETDESWKLANDHVALATAYEAAQRQLNPVKITVLSELPLARQIGAEGATWLDRQLVEGATPLREAGFGTEVNVALGRRRQWLVEQDLAEREGETIRYRANLLALLRRRELAKVGRQLSAELGLDYAEAPDHGRVTGAYNRSLSLASGRFAVIAKAREFTLVPWRPALEGQLGREVSGNIRPSGISWTIGRQRSGPSI